MKYSIKEFIYETKIMKRSGCNCYYISLLIVGFFSSFPLTTYSKYVNPKEAVEIAKRYITLSNDEISVARAKHFSESSEYPYYIFNDVQEKGFVIVSGNDEMGEVLAYSTEGTLDTLNVNPCVKFLLDGYRQTFEALKEVDGGVKGKTRDGLFSETVQPLLKSRWGQSHPYNAKTGYPYSGCVATAVAQIMYYYQWPANGYGKNEYELSYYHTKISADFSQSYYDWQNMLPDYRPPVSATIAQEDAVALLMSDIGIASFMQYTPDASGTQGLFAYKALQNNFDYTAAYVTRAVEGPSRFVEIIRQELLNGCPVYIEGHSAGAASGHAWVADGFDKNGLFHMNFGWEGQGDAYYSLANLSLSQTGSEFHGKPLAFNRAVTAILARPNNGKYPDIERGLLEESPQLMFNEGGSLTLKDVTDKTFNPLHTITVEMNSFVNKGGPFKGDVGVAIYDEDGNFRHVVFSDYHVSGGFTQRVYGADHDGFMGRDFLMNQAQSITVSLAGLADGYYRLIPVCVTYNENGTWDKEFFCMKKAPIIEVELNNGTGRISEMCADSARFQLMAQPRLACKAEQGGTVQTVFTVKNLNGVPCDCYVRVLLLDMHKNVVLNTRTDNMTEIEGFTKVDIPVVLYIPANIAPARYEIRLELSADEAESIRYPINNIHDKDLAFIDVIKAQEKPLMAKAEVFLADDSHTKITSDSIDISLIPNFKLGVSLRTSDTRSYVGPVSMFCEDILTMDKIVIQGFDDNVAIYSSFEVPLYSYWLRKSNLNLSDGHTYKIVVMGQVDGKDVELKSPQEPTFFIKRKGDILTLYDDGIPTSIESSIAAHPTFDISRIDNQLVVSGTNFRSLRLYDVSGRLFQQASIIDKSRATLSLEGLKSGIYILRIEVGKQLQTYRFFHNSHN